MTVIIIEDYDPEWPAFYEQERARILSSIGDLTAEIEHVGSTSVPGLGAKPIVDIMVGLREAEYLDRCVSPLQAIGYTYVPEYEEEMPFRRLFYKKPPTHPQAYNLHVVHLDHEFWLRHLLFRDYLRAHPEAARQYERHKRELAPQFTNTNDYAHAKTEFIRAMEIEAFMERDDKSPL